MRSLRGVALAVVMLATPSAAHAQPPSASMLCTPGLTSSCFALGLTTTETTMSVWLQNLQGTATPDAAPVSIFGMYLHRFNPLGPDGKPTTWVSFGGEGPDHHLVGDVVPAPGTGETWVDGNSWDDDVTGIQYRSYYNFWEDPTSILGCTIPPNEEPVPGDIVGATCPRDGYDGWIRIDFSRGLLSDFLTGANSRSLEWSDLQLTVLAVRDGGPTSTSCTYSVTTSNCAVLPYDVTVTPEPGTLALLGGGLGLLGLVGWRRRRDPAALNSRER